MRPILKNEFSEPYKPKRVVVIGSNGFIGNNICKRLGMEGIDILPLSRQDIDLEDPKASSKISSLLLPSDVVVAAAAKAPARNLDDLATNIRILTAICNACKTTKIGHLINISSDAVYGDEPLPLSETSIVSPGGIHGIMHMTRELVLSELQCPFLHVRPTLVYGPGDPHNGYGPNQFLRLALAGDTIKLFGEGEERRDHIFIDDVVEIIVLAILHRSFGVINAVTGSVLSFREIASMIVEKTGSSSKIQGSERLGKMPHNGLRTFDNTALNVISPKLKVPNFAERVDLFCQQTGSV